MREVILDTETTGLKYKEGDRVIEVGCVELINHIPSGNNLQFYCSTEKTINSEAAAVHGLTNDFLKKHPTFKEQAKQFLDFIKNDTLIIHNAPFDVGFINNELELTGYKKLENSVIDTVTLARKKLNTRIANLDYLCKRFSIDLSQRKLHGALKDCLLLADVYIELLGGKQTTMNLSKDSEVKKTKKQNTNPKKTSINLISISKEEIENHKKFVKGLKSSIWSKLDY